MSEQSLLQVKNVSVSIDELPILHGINLNIGAGETHVLMGPNGAGKSTLGYTLMGNPHYSVTDGSIIFDGQDITKASADKRAQAGMFLSFQSPLEVPGISLGSFIRNAYHEKTGAPVKSDTAAWVDSQAFTRAASTLSIMSSSPKALM